MADPNVKVVFEAVNRISAPIQKMAADVKTSTDRIRAPIQAVGQIVKTAGIAMIAGLAIDKLRSYMNEGYELYKKQEESNIKLIAALKSTANAAGITYNELKTMASGLQDVTTIGDEVIQSGQHILLTYKNIKGDIFKEAQESMLDLSVVTGNVDGAARKLGTALSEPKKAIESLREIGVRFSEDQQKQIKNFESTGRVADAQRIVLDQVKLSYGGLARSIADTPTGQVEQLKNIIGDVKEEIGAASLPIQKLGADIQLWLVNTAKDYLDIFNRIANAYKSKKSTSIVDENISSIKNTLQLEEQINSLKGLQKDKQLAINNLQKELENVLKKQADVEQRRDKGLADHTQRITGLNEEINKLKAEQNKYNTEQIKIEREIELQTAEATKAVKDEAILKQTLARIDRENAAIKYTEQEKLIRKIESDARRQLQIVGDNEEAKRKIQENSAAKKKAITDAQKSIEDNKKLYDEQRKQALDYNKNIEDLNRQLRESKLSDMDRELQAIVDWYGQQADIHWANREALTWAEEIAQARMQSIRDKYREKEETEAAKAAEKAAADAKRLAEERMQIERDIKTSAIGATEEISSAIFQISSMRHDRETQKEIEAVQNSKMSAKKKKAEIERIERESFERSRKKNVAEILIMGALASAKNIASYGFTPALIGPQIATTASIAAAVAIASAQKYAAGGIVPGNSFTGDRVLGWLNSREMVLSTDHQMGLWKFIQGVKSGNTNYTSTSTSTTNNSRVQSTTNQFYISDMSGQYKKEFEKARRRGEMDEFEREITQRVISQLQGTGI